MVQLHICQVALQLAQPQSFNVPVKMLCQVLLLAVVQVIHIATDDLDIRMRQGMATPTHAHAWQSHPEWPTQCLDLRHQIALQY